MRITGLGQFLESYKVHFFGSSILQMLLKAQLFYSWKESTPGRKGGFPVAPGEQGLGCVPWIRGRITQEDYLTPLKVGRGGLGGCFITVQQSGGPLS